MTLWYSSIGWWNVWHQHRTALMCTLEWEPSHSKEQGMEYAKQESSDSLFTPTYSYATLFSVAYSLCVKNGCFSFSMAAFKNDWNSFPATMTHIQNTCTTNGWRHTTQMSYNHYKQHRNSSSSSCRPANICTWLSTFYESSIIAFKSR